MVISGVSPEASGQRTIFFRMLFGSSEGYVCIAFLDKDRVAFSEQFFHYPNEMPAMLQAIQSKVQDYNVYFCPQLLGERRRKKDAVTTCTAAWADLDTCHPSDLLVQPSITIESSPDRYQALWLLEDPDEVGPEQAESLSKRIAYKHAPQGADRSGWDLTQLLRIPYTYNYKYAAGPDTPIVGMVTAKPRRFRPDDFHMYPEVTARPGMEMPAQGTLPTETGLELIQKFQRRINSVVWQLYSDPPEKESWSESLFKLEMCCFEAGMSKEEVYVVAQQAACNKYARDNRPAEQLWRDVGRAYIKHMENINAVVIPDQELAPLLSEEEIARLGDHETFVERYIKWASGLGDAATQYHQAGAFIILSSLLAGRVVLPTSFGNVLPNLWFMILADTTLTRKSTAMDIATDLLIEVDDDAIMATDGSLEGLMQGLSLRPGKPSIFLRDEFSGLLEAMTKKDYMAGMAETLTKLYDGKYMKRILRKESIEVKDPVLIIFAGGIKTRIQTLLTLDWVSSGFMPRFVYLTAESDVSKVTPLGPPKQRDLSGKEELLDELRALHERYSGEFEMKMPNGLTMHQPRKWDAELTPEAWVRFNVFEADLLKAGVSSERPDIMTPVFDRLGKSALKASILLAAADCKRGEVIVDEIHILRAIRYCEKWRAYAIDVINGVGQSSTERDLERIVKAIKQRPGISRSALMQNYHLTARNADQLFDTLTQRGVIRGVRMGQGMTYYLVREEELPV